MKFVGFLAALLIAMCAHAQVESPQFGNFAGNGKFKSETGETGAYDILTKFELKTVRGRALTLMTSKSRVRGLPAEWEIYFTEDRNGFFDVLDSNFRTIGDGYCFDFQCHISVQSLLTYTEETYTFQGPMMYVLGLRSQAGKKTVWQEILQRQ